MTIGDLLARGSIAPRVTATTKRQALTVIAEVAARTFSLDAGKALDALLAREAAGSTGVGRGVAIPHARMKGHLTMTTNLLHNPTNKTQI